MWKAVRYTTFRESGACNALTDELGNTATTITDTANFGVITDQVQNPRNIQFGLKYIF